MQKTLYILRGVSGSGKTTLAKNLENSLPNAIAVSADEFFEREGTYQFDASKLQVAHDWCKSVVHSCLCDRVHQNVIVHNTTTTDKELNVYLELAAYVNAKVVSLVVENRHGEGSVHGLIQKALDRQEGRLRNSIKLQ